RCDRLLHYTELACLDGDLVKEDRRDDDPGNPEKPELDTQSTGSGYRQPRHAEDDPGQNDCHQHPRHCRNPDPSFQDQEHEEKREHRHRRDERREWPEVQRVVILGPGHYSFTAHRSRLNHRPIVPASRSPTMIKCRVVGIRELGGELLIDVDTEARRFGGVEVAVPGFWAAGEDLARAGWEDTALVDTEVVGGQGQTGCMADG